MSDSVRPHRRQPTRLPYPWDSPGKNTGVGCHFLLQCIKVKVKMKSLSHVRLFSTPWTAAYQAPPSMRFSRQEFWSGLPLPSPLGCLLPPIVEALVTIQRRVHQSFQHVQLLCYCVCMYYRIMLLPVCVMIFKEVMPRASVAMYPGMKCRLWLEKRE